MVEPLPLVVDEEEQLFPVDRATEGSPEHVPTKRCAGNRWRARIDLILPLVGVQDVVAKKFPHVAVK